LLATFSQEQKTVRISLVKMNYFWVLSLEAQKRNPFLKIYFWEIERW
jgi:hypothetical protein